MPKDSPALAALKDAILKEASAEEKPQIEAVFEVVTELLDNTGRIADALENGAPQITVNMVTAGGDHPPAPQEAPQG